MMDKKIKGRMSGSEANEGGVDKGVDKVKQMKKSLREYYATISFMLASVLAPHLDVLQKKDSSSVAPGSSIQTELSYHDQSGNEQAQNEHSKIYQATELGDKRFASTLVRDPQYPDQNDYRNFPRGVSPGSEYPRLDVRNAVDTLHVLFNNLEIDDSWKERVHFFFEDPGGFGLGPGELYPTGEDYPDSTHYDVVGRSEDNRNPWTQDANVWKQEFGSTNHGLKVSGTVVAHTDNGKGGIGIIPRDFGKVSFYIGGTKTKTKENLLRIKKKLDTLLANGETLPLIVLNCSWGNGATRNGEGVEDPERGPEGLRTLMEELANDPRYNMIIVAAMDNADRDHDANGAGPDGDDVLPAGLPFVVAVGSVGAGRFDGKFRFTDRGYDRGATDFCVMQQKNQSPTGGRDDNNLIHYGEAFIAGNSNSSSIAASEIGMVGALLRSLKGKDAPAPTREEIMDHIECTSPSILADSIHGNPVAINEAPEHPVLSLLNPILSLGMRLPEGSPASLEQVGSWTRRLTLPATLTDDYQLVIEKHLWTTPSKITDKDGNPIPGIVDHDDHWTVDLNTFPGTAGGTLYDEMYWTITLPHPHPELGQETLDIRTSFEIFSERPIATDDVVEDKPIMQLRKNPVSSGEPILVAGPIRNSYTVYDMQGRVVDVKWKAVSHELLSFSTQGLPPGMYIIRGAGISGESSVKVIVQ